MEQHEIVCKYWDLYHLLCHMIRLIILGSPSPRGRYTTRLTGENFRLSSLSLLTYMLKWCCCYAVKKTYRLHVFMHYGLKTRGSKLLKGNRHERELMLLYVNFFWDVFRFIFILFFYILASISFFVILTLVTRMIKLLWDQKYLYHEDLI